MSADAELDRRLGHGPRAMAADHAAVIEQREQRLVVRREPAHEQRDAGLGRLVGEPLVLLRLDQLDDLHRGGGIDVLKARLARLGNHIGPAGKFAHHHPRRVADHGRVDVLVGVGVALHRGDMHARLVGEGAVADVGHVHIGREVGDLGREARDLVQVRERAGGQHAELELQLEIGDDHAEVGVAAAFTVAVDRALHVSRAGADRRQGVGHAATGVVVRMNADRHRTELRDDILHGRLHLPRQRTAVGVAQHDGLGAALHRCRQGLQCVGRVEAVAVEKMLGVVDDALPLPAQKSHGILHHLEVFLERGAEDFLYLQHRGFAKDGADFRAGLDQGADARVVRRLQAGAARGAERHDLRVLPLVFARLLEKRRVLRVGTRPAALDESHAQLVQLARDAQLVVD